MVIGPNSMSPKNLKSLEGEPGLKVVNLPDTVCNFLCMNTKKAPFDNIKVRQAIKFRDAQFRQSYPTCSTATARR